MFHNLQWEQRRGVRQFLMLDLSLLLIKIYKMKKIVFGFIVLSALVACTSQNVNSVKQPIGLDFSEDGNKADLVGGDTANVQLFVKFVNALNDRDTATIRTLEATENLKIYTPEGFIVNSVDTNLKHLSDWFTLSNPKWKLNFVVANSFTNKAGVVQQWATSGLVVSETKEGKEVKTNQYMDANIVNGRIQKLFIAERKVAAGE